MPLEVPLSVDDCQAVREAIDLSLSKRQLPATTINRTIYATRALSYVQARTANTDEHAHTALIYATAAMLCPAVPVLTSESIVGGSYSRPAIDLNARQAWLFEQALEEIAASEKAQPTVTIVAGEDASDMPFQFDVA